MRDLLIILGYAGLFLCSLVIAVTFIGMFTIDADPFARSAPKKTGHITDCSCKRCLKRKLPVAKVIKR